MSVAQVVEAPAPRTMTIRGQREPRYWRQSEDEYGHFVSTGQPGPVQVVVTHTGIQILNDTRGALRPGTARWLACRLIEATAIYETEYGGDGSVPNDGVITPIRRGPIANTSPVGGELPAEPEKKWLCLCGKASPNKGAMVIHTRTCDQIDGPEQLVEVQGGTD